MPSPVIAILDDEEDFRRALSRLLKAHGYEVVSVATGEALLDEIAQRRIDCVLLDLHMPGMSGFDVLAALQREEHSPPVIAVTARDDPEFERRALALHAFECQRKPVGALKLIAAIERARAR